MNSRFITLLLREPLLHFLLLGGVLFLLYTALGPKDDSAVRQRIVVDEAQLSRLSQQFQRIWMRPPTPDELEGLAADHVREEILYREALALGLDKGDLVIRRRMRQKMEFLNADLSEVQPTDAQLEAYLQANPESFRLPPRYSFTQIYLDPRRTDGEFRQRARELLATIQGNPDSLVEPAAFGDSTLLPATMDHATPRDIANTFGQDFADAVINAIPGAWSGPNTSAYGLHLLHVREHEPGKLPELAAVRASVEREWANHRRQKADARFYDALRSRYSIEIHPPEDRQAGAAAKSDRLAARP